MEHQKKHEEHEDGSVEVPAVNPVDSMQAVSNDGLYPIAEQIKTISKE